MASHETGRLPTVLDPSAVVQCVRRVAAENGHVPVGAGDVQLAADELGLRERAVWAVWNRRSETAEGSRAVAEQESVGGDAVEEESREGSKRETNCAAHEAPRRPAMQPVMDIMYELAAAAGRLVPGSDEMPAAARHLHTSEAIIRSQWQLRCVPIAGQHDESRIALMVAAFIARTGGYSVKARSAKDVAAIIGLTPQNYSSFYRARFERELRIIASAVDETIWGRGLIMTPLQTALLDVRSSLIMSSFDFTLEDLVDTILWLMRVHHVDVTLLVNRPSAETLYCAPVLNRLIRNGAHVYFPFDHHPVHSKIWIADYRLIIDGSFNRSAAALGEPGVLRRRLARNYESASFRTVELAEAKRLAVSILARCNLLQQDPFVVTGSFVTSMDHRNPDPEDIAMADNSVETESEDTSDRADLHGANALTPGAEITVPRMLTENLSAHEIQQPSLVNEPPGGPQDTVSSTNTSTRAQEVAIDAPRRPGVYASYAAHTPPCGYVSYALRARRLLMTMPPRPPPENEDEDKQEDTCKTQ